MLSFQNVSSPIYLGVSVKFLRNLERGAIRTQFLLVFTQGFEREEFG